MVLNDIMRYKSVNIETSFFCDKTIRKICMAEQKIKLMFSLWTMESKISSSGKDLNPLSINS